MYFFGLMNENEGSRPLDQTQPISVNSSSHKDRYSVKRVLTSFYCNIYIPSKIK